MWTEFHGVEKVYCLDESIAQVFCAVGSKM